MNFLALALLWALKLLDPLFNKFLSPLLYRDRTRFFFPEVSRVLACLLSGSLLLVSCGISPPPDRNIVELTLWHGINPPPNRDVFARLVDRFNQTHPDIHVTPAYIGQPDGQLPKILTAVVGNAPPDLLWFTPMLTGQLVQLGAIRSIEDWLNSSPVQSEIDPALLGGMTLDERIWSIPMATNNAGIFYRPSLFEAAGITQLPQNWEELRQAARQLTRDEDGDGRSDRYGMLLSLGKGEWVVFTWLPFLYSAGGELVQDSKPDLTNSGAIAALQFWSDLVADGTVVLSQPERGYELDDFLAGRVAMQITGPWTLAQLEATGIDYGVIPMPANLDRAAVVGGENLFVMKTTPERERAALEFLEYVAGEAFQIGWSLGTGYLPINLKARESQEYREFLAQQPVLEVFLDQMKWARSRPTLPNYSRLSDSLGRAIESTLLGTPPKQALEKAQARLDLIW